MCDPARIYPPPFQQLYATLPESTPSSQNTPPLSFQQQIMRPSQNLPLPPRIFFSAGKCIFRHIIVQEHYKTIPEVIRIYVIAQNIAAINKKSFSRHSSANI